MRNSDLDESKISADLDAKWRSCLTIHRFASLPSTNACALTIPPSASQWQLYVAETQTAGRGRLGRAWFSPAFENVYLSLSWAQALSLAQQTRLAALSLVAGLSVVAVLQKLVPSVHWQVKWPNDIWGNGQKVAGLLLESQKLTSQPAEALTQLVLGLGLNVNGRDFSSVERQLAPTSLALLTKRFFNRNRLIAALVNQLLADSALFFTAGLSVFQERWCKVDALAGQILTVTTSKGQERGIARGIDAHGYIVIEQEHGQLFTCSVGEIELLTY